MVLVRQCYGVCAVPCGTLLPERNASGAVPGEQFLGGRGGGLHGLPGGRGVGLRGECVHGVRSGDGGELDAWMHHLRDGVLLNRRPCGLHTLRGGAGLPHDAGVGGVRAGVHVGCGIDVVRAVSGGIRLSVPGSAGGAGCMHGGDVLGGSAGELHGVCEEPLLPGLVFELSAGVCVRERVGGGANCMRYLRCGGVCQLQHGGCGGGVLGVRCGSLLRERVD
mmetsp:Transcript_34826/g.79343  ORF Transcript_34826/g.79343 Transcript_34826/m.79343 type:complete len:221 (-) Transcript_34826:829-1491(-)